MAKQRTSLKDAKGGHKHRDLDELLGKVGNEAETEERVQMAVRVAKSARDGVKKTCIDHKITTQALLETVIVQFNAGNQALLNWVEEFVPKND